MQDVGDIIVRICPAGKIIFARLFQAGIEVPKRFGIISRPTWTIPRPLINEISRSGWGFHLNQFQGIEIIIHRGGKIIDMQ